MKRTSLKSSDLRKLRRAARRAETAPKLCPLCGFQREGVALAYHMRDAHGVRMSLRPEPKTTKAES
jgi:hypothetical protein